jgi:hypothetical protein
MSRASSRASAHPPHVGAAGPRAARDAFAAMCSDEFRRACRPATGLRRATEGLRSTPDLLSAVLEEIRGDKAHMAAIHRRSYWHPNGFAKLVLCTAPRYTTRLHIWPSLRPRHGDANPHAHRWVFASWVIAGRLSETTFAETESVTTADSVHERCEYGRDSGGDAYLRPQRPVALVPTATAVRDAGTVYDCPAGTVHTVAPLGSGLMATAVLQGPAASDGAAVYVRTGVLPEHREDPLTAADLLDLVETVQALLS